MSYSDSAYSSAAYSATAAQTLDFTSTGTILVSGTSEVTPFFLASQGTILVGGSSQFVAPQARAGGGSYLYPTSWDILKPYFPDDRHILGQRGQEAGHADDRNIPQTRDRLFSFLGDRNAEYPDPAVEILSKQAGVLIPDHAFEDITESSTEDTVDILDYVSEYDDGITFVSELTESTQVIASETRVSIAINPAFRAQILAEERWLEQELLADTDQDTYTTRVILQNK